MLRKAGIVLGILVLGAILGILGLSLWGEYFLRPAAEGKIRERYVADYTKNEQAKLGIDCKLLKPQFAAFLESRVSPVLKNREPGKNWETLVSAELKQESVRYREFVLACGRLYKVGDSGTRNGLQDLGFALEIDQDVVVMDILIRLGAPSQNCDAGCLDNRFRELQVAYERLIKRVKQ